MENETEYFQSLKKTLIMYIKIYDPLYADTNLDELTVEQLVIIKTKIEFKKQKKTSSQAE